MCGEHSSASVSLPHHRGSSPRVRGTRLLEKEAVVAARIIPACAGNTRHSLFFLAHTRDHPRVCGEHRHSLVRVARQPGSSPRVRGTLLYHESNSHVNRIIPACAGNTASRPPIVRQPRDHPRVCGEHFSWPLPACFLGGSSPRVRGTPFRLLLKFAKVGIIPACAGNTRPQFLHGH